MTTLESVHHPEATHRIAFVAWIAVMTVELAVHGTDLFIMGFDAGLPGGFAFASIALVMITVKALAWSSNWYELGWLFGIIGVCLMVLFASAIYDLAAPLASQVVHSEAYTSVQQQLTTNNSQLLLPDLSKESRIALLKSNETLTTQLSALNAADIEAMHPKLTLRFMFESIATLPQAPLSKWLCVILFGLIGIGLEVTNYRITPRRSTEVSLRPQKVTPARVGGLHFKKYIDAAITKLERKKQKQNRGQTPRQGGPSEGEDERDPAEEKNGAEAAEAVPREDAAREEERAEEDEVGRQPDPQANERAVAPDEPGSASVGRENGRLKKFSTFMLRQYPVVRSIDETIEKNPHLSAVQLTELYQELIGLKGPMGEPCFRWDNRLGQHVCTVPRTYLDKLLEGKQ